MGAIATTVVEVEPPPFLKVFQHRLAVTGRKVFNHIAEARDLRVQLQQCAKSVMAIDHPEFSFFVADKRNRFAHEITTPFLIGVTEKIFLTTANLGQPDAHLGGLQILNFHLNEREPILWLWDVVVVEAVQGAMPFNSGSLCPELLVQSTQGTGLKTLILTTPTGCGIGAGPHGEAATENR